MQSIFLPLLIICVRVVQSKIDINERFHALAKDRMTSDLSKVFKALEKRTCVKHLEHTLAGDFVKLFGDRSEILAAVEVKKLSYLKQQFGR